MFVYFVPSDDNVYRPTRRTIIANTGTSLAMLGFFAYVIYTFVVPRMFTSLVNHGIILPNSIMPYWFTDLAADTTGTIIGAILLLQATVMLMNETLLYRVVTDRYLYVYLAIRGNLRILIWIALTLTTLTVVLVAGDAIATSTFKDACGI